MHTIPTEVDGKAKRALNRQNAEASSPELEAPLLQQTKRPDRDTERLKQAEVMRVAKALKPAHRYMRWD